MKAFSQSEDENIKSLLVNISDPIIENLRKLVNSALKKADWEEKAKKWAEVIKVDAKHISLLKGRAYSADFIEGDKEEGLPDGEFDQLVFRLQQKDAPFSVMMHLINSGICEDAKGQWAQEWIPAFKGMEKLLNAEMEDGDKYLFKYDRALNYVCTSWHTTRE
ncbi:MAG: hypothetical protein K0R73_528 [Candidatus Midichloriaceae bacterium]|jgi:hypothetical protein|nr:hypothetical protein [Candidatus Midichloriaceae bacterium]